MSPFRGSRPKSARASPDNVLVEQSTPDFIHIGSLQRSYIAKRMNTAKTRRKVNPIFGFQPNKYFSEMATIVICLVPRDTDAMLAKNAVVFEYILT